MAEVRNAYVKARDLDTPVLDARLVARLWQAGRAAHDAAIGEPEGAAGPWAGDAAVADRALLQRAAHVSARAGQGIHRSVCLVQQDRYAARVGPAELPIGQFGAGQHRRPSPARASAWPPRLRPRARDQRGQVQTQRRGVQRGVHQADPSLRPRRCRTSRSARQLRSARRPPRRQLPADLRPPRRPGRRRRLATPSAPKAGRWSHPSPRPGHNQGTTPGAFPGTTGGQ